MRRVTASRATAATNLLGMRKDLTSLYAATIKRAMPAIVIKVCKISSEKNVSRKRPSRFRPRRWTRLAESGSQIGVDRGEHGVDGRAQRANRHDTHDGDQADENAVLDEGRTLIVLGKTGHQFTH